MHQNNLDWELKENNQNIIKKFMINLKIEEKNNMSTFVYMTRCDGCGHCVDICPSDIMHIDENIRRAKILNQIFVGNVIHV